MSEFHQQKFSRAYAAGGEKRERLSDYRKPAEREDKGKGGKSGICVYARLCDTICAFCHFDQPDENAFGDFARGERLEKPREQGNEPDVDERVRRHAEDDDTNSCSRSPLRAGATFWA